MTHFEIKILGSSSATPTTNRFPTSQIVKYENNIFLIDCGEGTQINLKKYKISFLKISHIFISHLHGDHYFGLIGLISSMHLLGRTTPLHIYAPKELKKIIEYQLKASETALNFEIIFVATKSNKKNLLFENSQISVFSFPVCHRIPTTGFVFEEKLGKKRLKKNIVVDMKIPFSDIPKLKNGEDIILNGKRIENSKLTLEPFPPRSYAFSSDTAFDENIVKYIKNVDLLYHETTFGKKFKKIAIDKFHSTTEDAATIAKLANAKQLIIGHFSARYSNTELENLLTEAQNIFPNTSLATEGSSFVIKAIH